MRREDGFIINEENRQHVGLSKNAMSVIEIDMMNFNDDYELKNRSGVINKIIENYYDQFPLAKNVVLKDLFLIRDKVEGNNFEKKLTDDVVEIFAFEIMKNIIESFSNKYPTDIPFKIKLNKQNISILSQLEDAKYFDEFAPRSGISFFIKILLESYATLSREQRERIFFRQEIEALEKAIKNSTLVRIKENGKIIKFTPIYVGKIKNQTSLRAIYRSEDNFLYTIKIKDLIKLNPFFLKEKGKINKEQYNELLIEYTQEKEGGTIKDIQTFVVEFTDSGLDRYLMEEDNYMINGIENPSNKYVYTFKTTEPILFKHIFNYGPQAKIISPLKTKQKFEQVYRAGYEHYVNEKREVPLDINNQEIKHNLLSYEGTVYLVNEINNKIAESTSLKAYSKDNNYLFVYTENDLLKYQQMMDFAKHELDTVSRTHEDFIYDKLMHDSKAEIDPIFEGYRTGSVLEDPKYNDSYFIKFYIKELNETITCMVKKEEIDVNQKAKSIMLVMHDIYEGKNLYRLYIKDER